MIVVVGAGVAGLTAVERLATAGAPVTLLTAGNFGADAISAGNTALAQGGIAAALGPDDSALLHFGDTMLAGAGLVDPAAAEVLTTEGAERVRKLLSAGFPADTDAQGKLTFGLEAAHRRARILHAGEDSTGAALSDFLTNRVQQLADDGRVHIIEKAWLTELVVANGRISGVCYTSPTGIQRLATDTVIMATGGYAGLFPTTSSSFASTGHGLLAAARAGAVVADMEFLQFHPTALAKTGDLLSEAVRGAGAVLRDPTGYQFLAEYHTDAELAPRDVVSRASFAVMEAFDSDAVFLDATVIEDRYGSGTLARRFPQLTAMLETHGIDWTRQYVPVAPAAHYCMGGVATDSYARTSIPGLLAAGELASTGVHGANRLASNSLLEGLVFGARAAETAQSFHKDGAWQVGPSLQALMDTAGHVDSCGRGMTEHTRLADLQRLIGKHLGLTRGHEGLVTLLSALDTITHPAADLLRIMATAALARTESRGGHWRADYPNPDPRQNRRTAWRLATTLTNLAQEQDVQRIKENASNVNV